MIYIVTDNGISPVATEPNKTRRTVMTDQDTFPPDGARLAARRGRWRAALGQGRHRWRLGWLASAAVIAAALIVAACGSSSAGGAASAPPGAASSAASSGYVSPTELDNVLSSVFDQPNFGGVMMW